MSFFIAGFFFQLLESNHGLTERQFSSPPLSQAAVETRTYPVKEETQIQSGQQSSIQFKNGLSLSSKGETTTQTLQNARAYVTNGKANSRVSEGACFPLNQSVEEEVLTKNNEKARVYSFDETWAKCAEDSVDHIAEETTTRVVDRTISKSEKDQSIQDFDETCNPSTEIKNAQEFGDIQKNAERQKTHSFEEGKSQYAVGQRSQLIK